MKPCGPDSLTSCGQCRQVVFLITVDQSAFFHRCFASDWMGLQEHSKWSSYPYTVPLSHPFLHLTITRCPRREQQNPRLSWTSQGQGNIMTTTMTNVWRVMWCSRVFKTTSKHSLKNTTQTWKVKSVLHHMVGVGGEGWESLATYTPSSQQRRDLNPCLFTPVFRNPAKLPGKRAGEQIPQTS